MLIEGKNSVLQALEGSVTFNKLFVEKTQNDSTSKKIIALAKNNGVVISFVDREFLKRKSLTPKHQGFLAEITDYQYSSVEEILNISKEKEKDAFILLLDEISDPHNLGAIIRSAECMGVDGIIIPKHRACAVNDTVMKTSAGALNNMKIAMVTNLNQTIDKLKEQNIWIYCLETGGQNITKQNLTGNIGLVVGSEGFGVSENIRKNCDGVITIDMFGKVNSLNASVATGMALYEIQRQRNN